MKELNKFIRINPIKVGEQEKHILTCGKYMICDKVFDSEEDAEYWYNVNGIEENRIAQIFTICQVANDLKQDYERSIKNSTDSNHSDTNVSDNNISDK